MPARLQAPYACARPGTRSCAVSTQPLQRAILTAMRVVTWNCRVGAFRRKAARVAPLQPDVLVVPEVERFDRHPVLDGERQPTFRQRLTNWQRGVGVFSYTRTKLMPAFAEDDSVDGCWPFTADHGGFQFQVVAVWTLDTPKNKSTSYCEAHEGLARYKDWIAQAPTVLLGDFNINASYKTGASWDALIHSTSGRARFGQCLSPIL